MADIFDVMTKQASDSLSTLNDRDLKSIIDTEAKAYALYTVQERAIPNMMDGLKPVQRFVMYRALQDAKTKFEKVASIAGGVSKAGYHHGEGSAEGACVLMANTWSNNTPLLEGDGNFGSRLVQRAAAGRYVFARIHDNWNKIYRDTEYAPKHEDPEHLPPRHYLPILPMVLANGVQGIATGYSTYILPHSYESLVECTKKAVEGTLDGEPLVKFPKFTGQITFDEEGNQFAEGTYTRKGSTKLTITEVPPKFDRETYIAKVMDPLEERGFISYDDKCGDNKFIFDVTLRKEFGLSGDYDADHDIIMRHFKLRQKISQNIVVIDEQGKLRDDFSKSSDVIKHFVKVRMKFTEQRIAQKIVETEYEFNLARAKAIFISKVISGEIQITGQKRADVIKSIESFPELKEYSEKLISMNLYHITKEEARKLVEFAKEKKEEHVYWTKTTAKVEYLKDLDNL
ncbi:DNA topoisomerase II subunit [Serratia phage SP1]|nr:DNA topoisomerase II subunit [Serratia phage SP1]